MGNRLATIEDALVKLNSVDFTAVRKVSNIYETEPVGFTAQDDFLNGAAELSTTKSPIQLLEFLLSVEKNLGRTRDTRWGPRTIDLDLLLFEDLRINTDMLVVPHPEMQNRRFVLQPLADIAADVVMPGTTKTIAQLLAETPDHSRIRLIHTSYDVERKIFED
jgi:2-amino-4-hydroxy-6-hydroxymethyldihydropteridine diphosphokinase